MQPQGQAQCLAYSSSCQFYLCNTSKRILALPYLHCHIPVNTPIVFSLDECNSFSIDLPASALGQCLINICDGIRKHIVVRGIVYKRDVNPDLVGKSLSFFPGPGRTSNNSHQLLLLSDSYWASNMRHFIQAQAQLSWEAAWKTESIQFFYLWVTLLVLCTVLLGSKIGSIWKKKAHKISKCPVFQPWMPTREIIT